MRYVFFALMIAGAQALAAGTAWGQSRGPGPGTGLGGGTGPGSGSTIIGGVGSQIGGSGTQIGVGPDVNYIPGIGTRVRTPPPPTGNEIGVVGQGPIRPPMDLPPPPGVGPSLRPRSQANMQAYDVQPKALYMEPGSSFTVRSGNVVLAGAGGAGGGDVGGATNLRMESHLNAAAAWRAEQAAARTGPPNNVTIDFGDRWRYRWHEGRWWFWAPQNHWTYFHDGRWLVYSPSGIYAGSGSGYVTSPFAFRYGTGFRGYYDPGAYYESPMGNYYGPGPYAFPETYRPGFYVPPSQAGQPGPNSGTAFGGP